MSFRRQEHHDAYRYVLKYHTSGFERKLIDLLAIADGQNTAIIDDNWGHVIDRMANMYREGLERENSREGR